MATVFLMAFLVFFFSQVSCEFKLTGVDVSEISKFQKYFSSQCFVFVVDREDVTLAVNIKSFGLLYFAVVNSSRLRDILTADTSRPSFLRSQTTIVTKEHLNLTSLLDTVSQPHCLTWIVLKDPALFRGSCIPVHSQVFFVHPTRETVEVKEVYNLECGVNETTRTVDWKSRSVALRRLDFQGTAKRMLFLTSREVCPNLHKLALLRKLECVHWDLIEIMGQKLNFSVSPVECKEKEFPFTFPNGSDSELFLKIKHREVEFSAIGHVISVRGQRSYIDFIWPTFALKSRMYLKQGKLVGRWSSYLKPLESSVWWGILICVGVFGVGLQICERLLNTGSNNFGFPLNLVMSSLRTLQVFCNQAITDVPAFWSIRMLYLLMFSVVLVFFQAYCGYLVSSLTVVNAHFPFSDLEGFFANPLYKVMTLQRGFHQYYFRKIAGKDRRSDFILERDQLPQTVQDAVYKLCAEKYLAFAEFREDLLDFGTPTCRISELPNPVLRLHVGIAMPANAPLMEFLKRELLNLRSAGILERFESRLSSQASDVFKDRKSVNEFSSVSMYHIFSIFILLGFGILLSLCALMFEVLTKRVRRKSEAPVRKKKL